MLSVNDIISKSLWIFFFTDSGYKTRDDFIDFRSYFSSHSRKEEPQKEKETSVPVFRLQDLDNYIQELVDVKIDCFSQGYSKTIEFLKLIEFSKLETIWTSKNNWISKIRLIKNWLDHLILKWTTRKNLAGSESLTKIRR